MVLNNEDLGCCICKETTGKIGRLKCPNCKDVRLHAECISKHFESKKTCPQCRSDISIRKCICVAYMMSVLIGIGKMLYFASHFYSICILILALMYKTIYLDMYIYYIAICCSLITKFFVGGLEYYKDTISRRSKKYKICIIVYNTCNKILLINAVIILHITNISLNNRKNIFYWTMFFDGFITAPIYALCAICIAVGGTWSLCKYICNTIRDLLYPKTQDFDIEAVITYNTLT